MNTTALNYLIPSRRTTAVLLAAAIAAPLAISPVSHVEPLMAQAAEQPETISIERFKALTRIVGDFDEPLDVGGRNFISSLSVDPDAIVVEALVDWNDGKSPIKDMVVNCTVDYKKTFYHNRDKDMATRGTYERLQALAGSGKTNAQGEATVKIPLKGAALCPGEYVVKAEIKVASQSADVIAKMRKDARLYGKYPSGVRYFLDRNNDGIFAENEEGNKAEAERAIKAGKPAVRIRYEDPKTPIGKDIKKQEEAFDFLLAGFTAVTPTQSKIYVLPDGKHWLDNGSLGNAQQIIDRAREVKDIKDKLITARVAKPKNDQHIADLEAQLKLKEEALAVCGGELTQAEAEAMKRARTSQARALETLAAFDESIVKQYLDITHGDFDYWRWRTVELLGVPAYQTCVTGKLPWQQPGVVQRSGAKVTDERSWKNYLKQNLGLLVNGDPQTWPEKKADLPKETKPVRGGRYSENLLRIMESDIEALTFLDAKDPSKGLVLYKNGSSDSEGYVLNEAKWIELEQKLYSETGYDANDADVKKLTPYHRTPSEARSTGDRVRKVNMSANYLAPNRFSVVDAAAGDAIKALALLPKAFRYSHYVDLIHVVEIKQPGGAKEGSGDSASGEARAEKGIDQKAVNSACGKEADFPMWARRRSTDLTGLYNQSVITIKKELSCETGIFATIFFYTDGAGRNFPKDARDKELAASLKALQKRKDVIGKPRAEGSTEGSTLEWSEGGTGSGDGTERQPGMPAPGGGN